MMQMISKNTQMISRTFIESVVLSNGLRINCLPNTQIERLVSQVFGGVYTPEGKEWIYKTDTIIDIGAHIGLFSLFAAPNAKRVLSFEPHPDNYQKLVENVRQNGINNIKTFNLAVGQDKGKANLNVSTYGEMHSLFYNWDARESEFYHGDMIEISVVTLSDIFMENNIDNCGFLKLDCEGAEYEILLSTPSNIFERIDRIVLEYHNNLTEYSGLKLSNFIKSKNFNVKQTKTYIAGCGMIYAERG